MDDVLLLSVIFVFLLILAFVFFFIIRYSNKRLMGKISDLDEKIVRMQEEMLHYLEGNRAEAGSDESPQKEKEASAETVAHEARVKPTRKSDVKVKSMSSYAYGNDVRVDLSLENRGMGEGAASVKLIQGGRLVYSWEDRIPPHSGNRVVKDISNLKPGKMSLIVISDESSEYEMAIPENTKYVEKLVPARLKHLTRHQADLMKIW